MDEFYGVCFVYTLNLIYVDGTKETIHLFTRSDKRNIVKVKFGRSGDISEETILTKEEGRDLWAELVRNGWKPTVDADGNPLKFSSSHTYFDNCSFNDRMWSYGHDHNTTNYALTA